MASLPPPTVTTIANISTQIGVSTSPTVFSYAATTQYTPPAECLQNTYIWGTGSSADIQIAPDYLPSCWPAPWPSLSGSLSPAFCPAGYTIASLSAYLGRFISDVDNASAGIGSYTETHLTCCPALTHPFSGVDASNNCRYSFGDAIATELVTLRRFDSLTALVTDGTAVSESTTWTTVDESGIGLTSPFPSARALRVAFQQTDQDVLAQWSASVVYVEPIISTSESTSAPPSLSSTSSSTFVIPTGNSGGGSSLSGGGVAFVAVGVVLGLCLIVGVVYFGLRYRKKQKRMAIAEHRGDTRGWSRDQLETQDSVIERESQVPLSHTPNFGRDSPAFFRDSTFTQTRGSSMLGRDDLDDPNAIEMPTKHVAAIELPGQHKSPLSELHTPVHEVRNDKRDSL